MADVKISALPGASTPLDGTEILPIVQGGITEQVSVANLTAGRTVAAATVNVDASSATSAVRITQTSTGNAFLVEDTSPDASPFVIDGAGRLNIGSLNWYASGGITPSQQFNGTGQGASLALNAWQTGTSTAARLIFNRSDSSTVGDFTDAVDSGDQLGLISFAGSDGAAFIDAASIEARVDGTPGTNDMPGRLVFSTTADGASTPTERMRINSAGEVGIGLTATTGNALAVGKTATGAASTRGVGVYQTIQSDSATGYQTFRSSPATAAAAFTLTDLTHYATNQGTIGATSAITTQTGFSAASNLTGATNNYGFFGNIAAGTGRWNFYAAGTAANAFSGDVTIFGAGGLGYSTGSGGAVTQATSRTTGVTLNKTNGAITLFSAAGLATYQSFTVTNSAVAATDTIILNQKSGTDKYILLVTAVAAGSFQITFATTGGTTTEQPVFNFAVIKAVAA